MKVGEGILWMCYYFLVEIFLKRNGVSLDKAEHFDARVLTLYKHCFCVGFLHEK